MVGLLLCNITPDLVTASSDKSPETTDRHTHGRSRIWNELQALGDGQHSFIASGYVGPIQLVHPASNNTINM